MMSARTAENDVLAYGFGLLRSINPDAPDPLITGGLDHDVECVIPPEGGTDA